MPMPSRLSLLAAAFALCVVVPAHTEDVKPPLVERGIIGGWTVHTSGPNVFIPSPDGKFFVVGRLFAATSGQDVGAALTASEPAILPDEVLAYFQGSLLQGGAGEDCGESCSEPCDACSLPETPTAFSVTPPAAPKAAAPAASIETPPASSLAPPTAAAATPIQQAGTGVHGETVDRLDGAFGFEVGTTGPPVIMVVDPACPWCTKAVHALTPAIEQGLIRLVVRPVAFVSPNSLNMIGAILTDPDPAAEFMRFMAQRMREPSAEPKAFDIEKLTVAMRTGVRDNMQLMRDLKIGSVPFFAWNDRDGRSHAETGLPEGLRALLAQQ